MKIKHTLFSSKIILKTHIYQNFDFGDKGGYQIQEQGLREDDVTVKTSETR